MIGDLVRSRQTGQRRDVHLALTAALERVEAANPSVDGLEPTVGDEFQGVYTHLGSALGAALLIRLELLDVIDTRFGIGAGRRHVLDAARVPPLQDGSGWWAAREAIDIVSASRQRRTWFAAAPGEDVGDAPGTINALLVCRDALVDRLGARGRQMLIGALHGRSQREIAAATGVSGSAVSQQFARGVAAVRDAHELVLEATGTARERGGNGAGPKA